MEPIFDKQEALVQVGGDPAFLREVIETFIADFKSQLADIDAAIEQKDAVSLRRAAHTIKGSASVLAASQVKDAARALERHGRDAKWEEIPEALITLSEALAMLLPELRVVAPTPSALLFQDLELRSFERTGFST